MTVKNTKKPSDTKKNLASNTEKASPKEKIQGIFTSINKNKDFYIACIGTSAGGIKAIEEFFSNCPDNIGIAYIIISHLDPKHISILPEIIQRSTTMPVVQIEDGIKVEPNCIYVIPPNNKLDIFHGALYLTELKNIQHHNLAINYFLKSLAQDQLDKAICIILSGMGTDGTLGLKAVKAEYGLCFVQNPETAQFNGMPCSAVSTNLADFILSPAKMPEALVNYVNKPLPEKAKQKGAIDLKSLKSLEKVFFLLRSSSGHDFSNYKENTINRRIDRRMNVLQINDIALYIRYLQETPAELNILFKELLIGVTSFFRDLEAFRYLEEQILPDLIRDKPDNYNFRVWVPGCSTGQEAYSLAIIIKECMDKVNKNFNVQIFATDIDGDAIETARKALFSSSISKEISSKRLSMYFTKDKDSSYQINKNIREMVIFAPQSIIKDPPFTKLDMLSCRNLLIYINASLQKKILSLFHYSIKPNGILFLGSSESVGNFLEYFTSLDKKLKIFKRSDIGNKLNIEFPMRHEIRTENELEKSAPKKEDNIQLDIERYLLANHVPPCSVINSKGDIEFIHGQTGKYFELPQGKIRKINIIEIARKGLKQDIVSSIHSVNLNNKPCVIENLQITPNGTTHHFNLIAKPLPKQGSLENFIMVMFEPIPLSKVIDNLQLEEHFFKKSTKALSGIEKELQYTQETLQTTTEEMELSNEQLKSTNEELQSTNEELQSSNEELETSKEEQQSLNEELTTVNAELQKKIDELSETSSDIKNLMNSIEVPTLFLDSELRIKRYTEQMIELINLIPSDIGRPISHIVTNLKYDNIVSDSQKVIKTLIPLELEIESSKGLWYSMKILPYRTLLNVIDGASISFYNITELKKYELEILKLSKFPSANPNPVLRVAIDKTILYCNSSALELLKAEDYKIGSALTGVWAENIDKITKHGRPISNIEIYQNHKIFSCNFILINDYINIYGIDITELKKASNMCQSACLYAQSIVETVREPLFVLDSNKKVISANRSFYEFFEVDEKETIGVSIYKLGNAQWAILKFKKLLEEMLADRQSIKDFEIIHKFESIGKRKILVNANKIFHEKEMILISLSEQGIT